MAQREMKQLTTEEKKIVQERIISVRQLIGYEVGDPINYEVLKKAQNWCLSHFRYKSDSYTYGKNDFWNPLAFDWVMLDGYLEDDCDGYGYMMIGFLVNVLQVPLDRVFRVSCKTETNEGHFVVWVQADDKIYYQVENRIRVPRTIKYMRELGYTYWHYSDMTSKNIKPNRWFNAEKRASQIIYNTPANLKADEPIITTKKLVRNIPNSKTLQLGTGVGISSIVGVVTTLASQTDWKIVALIGGYGLIITGLIFYIRGKTFTALDLKTKDKRSLIDENNFIA